MEMMCTLIVVKDMETSTRFYTELLGMKILQDLGANVTLDSNLA